MSTPNTAMDIALQALEALDEDGPVPREDIRILWEFDSYLINICEAADLRWIGHTFRDKGWSVLLVVKVVRDMTPLVAFITERSTRDCMSVFLRKMREGTITWVPDKYA